MLKLCGDSTWKLPEIIFKNYVKEVIFPNEWERASVAPIQKKKKKMINKSYLIIDQFPFFQFIVRYLNVSYIIQCTNI